MQVNARDIDITWVVACRFHAPRCRVLILCSGWINRGPRTPPAQSKPYRDLGRLVNGTTRTTNERDMWMTVMPPKSEVQRAGPLRLVFHVRCDTLAEVRVWNYNKSLVMSSLGVRQAAVAVDGTDDGVIMSLVLNTTSTESAQPYSFLLILNATNFDQLANVPLPYSVPLGFHGRFYPPPSSL